SAITNFTDCRCPASGPHIASKSAADSRRERVFAWYAADGCTGRGCMHASSSPGSTSPSSHDLTAALPTVPTSYPQAVQLDSYVVRFTPPPPPPGAELRHGPSLTHAYCPSLRVSNTGTSAPTGPQLRTMISSSPPSGLSV